LKSGRLDLIASRRTMLSAMMEKSHNRKKSKTADPRELDIEISFLEGLVRRDPGYVDALQLLGDGYTRQGRFEEGLGVDRKLSEIDPRNPLSFYNLACSLSLTGKLDEAGRALESALDLGYRDFKWMTRDPDLKALRKHPHYARLREKIGRMKIDVK
jgi:tetratricopeptide (TPR) repeat protein